MSAPRDADATMEDGDDWLAWRAAMEAKHGKTLPVAPMKHPLASTEMEFRGRASLDAEMFWSAANAHADRAMYWGLLGKEVTAQAYAQNAELCALLALVYRCLDGLPRPVL